MTKICIQEKEYELKWNTRALIRFRKLAATEDKIEEGLNLLWACLPSDAFDSPEEVMDAVKIEDIPSVIEKMNEVLGGEKKEPATESLP